MENKPNKMRRVGRPKEGTADAARASLIAAGAELFSRDGFGATKIAHLAKKADVTPAMVHYYFGGKKQLAEAVLEEAFEPLITQIQEIDTLENWVIAFHGLLMKNRWLPSLMHREVLTSAGHLSEIFKQRYALRLVPKWLDLMAAEKRAGRVRPEIDEFRHVMFLVATLVHPFLIGHMVTPFHDGSFSDDDLIAFRDDALAMFRRGTAPSE
jgi:TetR/AcrR family transcriptional regulator